MSAVSSGWAGQNDCSLYILDSAALETSGEQEWMRLLLQLLLVARVKGH